MGEGRVYLPVTAAMLRLAREDGRFRPPLQGHAVTDELADDLGSADQEELEYAAMTSAALDALALLRPDGRPRRLVAAVDVGAWTRVVGPDADAGTASSAVEVTVPVPFGRLAAVHADSDDAAPAVRAAVRALTDGGAEPDTTAAVERCLDHELGWYAVQELDSLLGD
ncbi:MAG: hypothetical protein QOK15_77 [Nocardioidaceae bacterium]|nr:hypothetical protein [Nocardioidaceae bacterium]